MNYTQSQSPQRHHPFEWWYRLTAMPEPPPDAPLARRELVRRTRQASSILVVITAAALAPIPVALQQKNVPFFVTLVITLVAYVVALLALNRRGRLAAAGTLILTV